MNLKFASVLLRPITCSRFVPLFTQQPEKFQISSSQFSKCWNLIFYNSYRKIARKNCENSEGFDESKANLIVKMNFDQPSEALPFYKLNVATLIRVYKGIKADEESGFCKNRLYYIAERIKIPPEILSRYIAKRTFVYLLSSDWLENSLNVLLEMGVPGDRIQRDLWVLKYHHKTIRKRLQQVKDMGIDTLFPWMVRCTGEILNRAIQISQETKNILGNNSTTQMYLANRLNVSPEAVEEMTEKIPALKTIRVIKVKSFLDFLFNEGFEVKDIAEKPRVLTASQNTVRDRLEYLRKMGVEDINLNILCRSKKDFKKYCESLQAADNKNDKSDN